MRPQFGPPTLTVALHFPTFRCRPGIIQDRFRKRQGKGYIHLRECRLNLWAPLGRLKRLDSRGPTFTFVISVVYAVLYTCETTLTGSFVYLLTQLVPGPLGQPLL